MSNIPRDISKSPPHEVPPDLSEVVPEKYQYPQVQVVGVVDLGKVVETMLKVEHGVILEIGVEVIMLVKDQILDQFLDLVTQKVNGIMLLLKVVLLQVEVVDHMVELE